MICLIFVTFGSALSPSLPAFQPVSVFTDVNRKTSMNFSGQCTATLCNGNWRKHWDSRKEWLQGISGFQLTERQEEWKTERKR